MSGFDVEEYLRTHLADVNGTGKERVATCPGCGKAGKFYCSVDPPYGFICFSCETSDTPVRGRGPIALICAVEGVSRGEAFKRIVRFTKRGRAASPADLNSMLSKMRDGARDVEIVDVPLPDNFAPCFDGVRWRWPKYLTDRGITREAVQRFGIGYSRGGKCSCDRVGGHASDCAARYRSRIIIPITCPNGRSFTARDTTGTSSVKYLNPKKSDGAEHGRLVFGWPAEDEDWVGSEVFIVEGPLDAVRMWQHGLPAIALLGKVLRDEKMQMLAGLGASGFVVLLDPEEAEAPVDAAANLSAIAERVWIAKLPMGIDPGKSSADQVRAAYMAAKPFKGRRTVDLAAALAAGRGLLRK